MNRTLCHRPRRRAAVFLVVFLVLFSLLPAYATAERTDDELLSDAYEAYKKGDWLQAALLFSAYLDRAPALLQVDAQRRQNVEDCFKFARDRLGEGLLAVEPAWRCELDLKTCRSDLRLYKTEVVGAKYEQLNGVPPPLPLPLPATAAAPSRPLVCRGGGALEFGYDPSSKATSRPEVWVRFEKAPFAVGARREHIESLQPGQCAWLDRSFSSAEPSEIHLRPPVFWPNSFHVLWTPNQVRSVGRELVFMMYPNWYSTYSVYDDRQGSFIAAAFQPCTPGPGQVTLYTDIGFSGRAFCIPKDVGTYLTADEMGFRDGDTRSSIMVGSDVRAYLCSDDKLQGRCVYFTADDADLSDNFVSGKGGVSSLRVERQDKCEPGPNEVGLFMNYKFDPPCERKSIGRYDIPGAIGLPPDSISSVRVGKNVTLRLCQSYNLAGPCQDFTSGDYDLRDYAIGDNRVASLEVRTR